MKFVVAIDGTPHSDRALDHAATVARAADASLTVVHAVDPTVQETGASDPVADIPDAERSLITEPESDAEARGERILAAATQRLSDEASDVPVDTELLYGTPVEEVPRFASTGGYDGIFVGHRDLSETQERVLGSIAKALVERSSLPVTVVG